MSENTKEDYPDLPIPKIQTQSESYLTRVSRLFLPRRMFSKDLGNMIDVDLDERLSGATSGGALIIVRNLLNNDEVRRQIFYSSTEHATSAEELQFTGEDFEPTHEATVLGFVGRDGMAGYIIAPNVGPTRFHEPNRAGEVVLRPLRQDEAGMLVPEHIFADVGL